MAEHLTIIDNLINDICAARDKKMPRENVTLEERPASRALLAAGEKLLQNALTRKAAEELLPVQMPMWDEDKRAYPNSLMRGALFTASKTSQNIKRDFFENKLITTLAGIRIEYNGQELRQDDASVFMTILHYARNTVLGEPIRFTAYGMLKELGWSINKVEYLHLRACCTRLSATSVTLSHTEGAEGFNGSLVRSFSWADKQNKQLSNWEVQLEPKIGLLYSQSSFTEMEWEQRRSIGGRAPLALWLHSFLCTHRKPLAISVSKYHELSASRAADLNDFRRRLHLALIRLTDVGFLKAYSIRGDIVHVERTPKGEKAASLVRPQRKKRVRSGGVEVGEGGDASMMQLEIV
jgi:hypothetical protein